MGAHDNMTIGSTKVHSDYSKWSASGSSDVASAKLQKEEEVKKFGYTNNFWAQGVIDFSNPANYRAQ